MRFFRKSVVLAATLSCAALIAAGCASGGEALYQKKCSTCHELSTVENSSYAKTGEWDSIVASMKQQTSTISDDDASSIIEYLNEAYPGD